MSKIVYKNPPKLTRILSEEEIRKIRNEKRLASISLRIPCGCNFDCKYCYGRLEKGKPLTYNEIINVLNQAFNLGAKTVSIVGEGEPLLYRYYEKDVFDLIDYINKNGADVVLFTNTTLVTKDIAKKLYKRNITIVGKQLSLNPNIENELTRRPWASKKMKEGLSNLIRAGFNKTQPSRLSLFTLICKQNIKEIPTLWRKWRKQNIVPYIQVFVPPTHPERQKFYKEMFVPSQKVKKLFYRLAQIDKKEFDYIWDPDRTYPIVALGCSVVYTSCGITPTGNVQICAYTENPLGNIREKSLKDILNSQKCKKIRMHNYSGKIDNLHYGCRALTLNLTRDRFAKDPFFWK